VNGFEGSNRERVPAGNSDAAAAQPAGSNCRGLLVIAAQFSVRAELAEPRRAAFSREAAERDAAASGSRTGRALRSKQVPISRGLLPAGSGWLLDA
jgi:hypothetical protein